MQEIWKNIKGYEGVYQVSNLGEVRRIYATKPSRILKPAKDKFGYYRVSLCLHGEKKNFFIHRLVATAFIENSEGFPVVNHKDENVTNNNADNLEWCSVQYNTCYNNAHFKRAKKLSKPILQLTLDGQVVKEWIGGRSEIERELGYNGGDITACCLNYPHCKSAHGYKWVYKEKK